MQCNEVVESLSPYFDGELASAERLAIDEHLAGCAERAEKLESFEAISRLTSKSVDPLPPPDLYERLRSRAESPERATQSTALPSSSSSTRRWLIVASLIAISAVIVTAVFWPGHHDDHDTVNLDGYLTAFAEDPESAQQHLVGRYENQKATVASAARQLGYQPAAAGRLPDGVTVEQLTMFDMPCCRCLQTICKADGEQTVVVFEHVDEHSFEFGDRPTMTCRCKGRKTRIVEFDGQLVASWMQGRRHLTLIGARDLEQVVAFVERIE